MSDQPKRPMDLLQAWFLPIWKGVDRVSLLSLVAANVVPILLAIVFRWNIGGVVLFYWVENLVIGVYAILRIAFASGTALVPNPNGSKFFLIPFFTVHYFGFCAIHGVFLGLIVSGAFSSSGPSMSMNSSGGPLEMLSGPLREFFAQSPVAAAISIGGLFVSHGISFARNYLRKGEYRTALPIAEMFRPYARIVLLHICILFGGFLVALAGSSLPLVILFMLGKTALDVVVHCWEHRGRQSGAPVSAASNSD